MLTSCEVLWGARVYTRLCEDYVLHDAYIDVLLHKRPPT